MKRKTLEESLLEQGLITKEKLEQALREQKQTGKPFRNILISKGIVSEEDLIVCLSVELGIPSVNLSYYSFDPEVIRLVPEEIARRYEAVPVFKIKDTLTMAMVDPTNVFALDELQAETGCIIEPVVATEADIQHTIDQYYGVSSSMEQLLKSIDKKELIPTPSEEESVASRLDWTVIRLVNLLIIQAVRDGASDIHIEPEEKQLRVRYRTDGTLHKILSPPKHLESHIISRIKVMANMNIAEKRLPQDGRIQIRIGNKDIDLRVSTQPTIFGENIVMRILDRSSLVLGLEKLGFMPEESHKFETIIKRPYGIILVTGPTGSGKTTTLYAALSRLNSSEKNIMTIEDPVEYQLGLIRQTQINPVAGLTFESGLRAILRQDPDIVMVGEIRDLETAGSAVRAALTGHLVFSTVHTNDAAGAFARLIDIGVKPFLISSSVVGVVAQRLVRCICPKCKEEYEPSNELLSQLEGEIPSPNGNHTFYHGRGCKNCRNTGYKGRTGVFELLVSTTQIQDLVMKGASTEVIKQAAIKEGMHTLRDSAIQKVLAGVTTFEELMRVTQEEF